MTLEELVKAFNLMQDNYDKFLLKFKDAETKISVLELRLDETEKFNKKLIEALLQAETEFKKEQIYFLPQGTFYGIELK